MVKKVEKKWIAVKTANAKKETTLPLVKKKAAANRNLFPVFNIQPVGNFYQLATKYF